MEPRGAAVDGPSRRFGGWRASLTWSVAIVVAVLALIAVLLGQAGRPLAGDLTPAIATSVPLQQLAPGDQLIQTVTAADDRFAGVQITFGTFFGTARCTLQIEVRGSDGVVLTADGPVLAEHDVSCADLPDSSPDLVLTFDAIQGSAGRTYDVVVTRTDEGTQGGAVVWSGAPLDGSAPAVVDGKSVSTTALVRPMYDPQARWGDQLGVVMSRMAAYGPGWATTGPFVALLALLVLVLAALPWVVRRPRVLLVLIVIAAVARGLLWAAVVPAFSAMDEPAHFANVQYIATEHQLPGRASNHALYSDQVSLAIGELNLLATTPGDRPPFTAAGEQRVTSSLDAASTTGGGGGPAAAYPPPYYLAAAAFYPLGEGEFFSSVMAARMWSVLLGVVGAVVLWLIGRHLYPKRPLAQVAFATAGIFQPMAGHQFAIVNNDAWVIVCGFIAFLVALRLAERGRAPWLSLAAGLVLGAGLLGKPFAIAVAVPLGVGWLIGKVRHRVRSVRVVLGEAGLAVLGVLVTYGAWRVAARLLDIPSQAVPNGDGGLRSRLLFIKAQLGVGGASLETMWGNQLWGNFGWVRIPYAEPVPRILLGVGVLVAVGLGVWLLLLAVRAWQGRRRGVALEPASQDEGPRADRDVDVLLAVTAAQLVGIVGALYSAAWIYYVSTGANDLLQGRYALLALPAILAAPALLAERFVGRIAGTVVLVLLAAGMVALTLTGMDNTLRAFYG